MHRMVVMVVLALGVITGAITAANAEEAPVSAEQGRIVYERHCIACHGPQGRGGGYGFFPSSVADLTAPATKGKPDKDLREALIKGRPHPAMGSWKSVLSDSEIDEVLAYVRTFKHEPLGGTP